MSVVGRDESTADRTAAAASVRGCTRPVAEFRIYRSVAAHRPPEPATIAYLLCQSTNAVNPIDSYDSVIYDSDGNTALLCAIDVSQHNPVAAHEIVKALIDAGADIEARGWMDKTPFLKACSRGCLDILQLLVSRGCNIHAEARDVVNTSGPDLASIFNTSQSFQQYVRSLYPP